MSALRLIDEGGVPAHIVDDLDKIDGLANMESLQAAGNLFGSAFRRLVDHDPTWHPAGMTAAIKVHRTRHHAEHLGVREERD